MSRSDFELKTPEQLITMRKAGLITAKALGLNTQRSLVLHVVAEDVSG